MRSVDKIGFLLDMEMICLLCGGSITSWIRTPKRNAQVGGGANSLHILGYAVDIVFDNGEGQERAMRIARKMGYDRSFEGDHLHVEYDTHRDWE